MIPVVVDIDAAETDFAEGALSQLIGALRRVPAGEHLAIRGSSPSLRSDIVLWSRITGHAIVEEAGLGSEVRRFVIRKGPAPVASEPGDGTGEAPGERLWIYTNFDCNLACTYCCVRSGPQATPRRLDAAKVRALAEEAPALGFRRIFVTGGEPFLAPEIRELLAACTDALPTTVLTNGTLLRGARGKLLEVLPRDRLVLQISLDSPTPERHDRVRGSGSWRRAWGGIVWARERGFRVRVAATLPADGYRATMDEWLAANGVAPEDRVLRPVARRGFAQEGLSLAKGELVPELTLTAQGAYWHPVGADDDDFLVLRPLGSLAEAAGELQRQWNEERASSRALAEGFPCA